MNKCSTHTYNVKVILSTTFFCIYLHFRPCCSGFMHTILNYTNYVSYANSYTFLGWKSFMRKIYKKRNKLNALLSTFNYIHSVHNRLNRARMSVWFHLHSVRTLNNITENIISLSTLRLPSVVVIIQLKLMDFRRWDMSSHWQKLVKIVKIVQGIKL